MYVCMYIYISDILIKRKIMGNFLPVIWKITYNAVLLEKHNQET